ncbi:MAG: hypothetical protein Q9M89_08860 [Persephonella sp.]|nr:hypothetical protein [Persephonella sp.]
MEEDKSKTYSGNGNEISIHVGVLIHRILEKINLNSFSLKEAEEMVDSLSSTVPEKFRKPVLSQVIRLLERYPSSQIDMELKDGQILFRELPFHHKEGDRFIEGRIDLVYQKKVRYT